MSPRRCISLRVLLVAGLLLAATEPATPAEIGVFLSGADPGESWSPGWGGTFTITLFNLVGGELEGAWQPSDLPSTSLFSLSAKAYIGPSFGRFVPYGGIGAGVYRESVLGDSDTGTLGLVFVGFFNFQCENDCNPESAKFVGAAVGVAIGAGLGAAVGSRIQVDRWEEVSVGFAVGPRPGKGVAWAFSLSF